MIICKSALLSSKTEYIFKETIIFNIGNNGKVYGYQLETNMGSLIGRSNIKSAYTDYNDFILQLSNSEYNVSLVINNNTYNIRDISDHFFKNIGKPVKVSVIYSK